VNTGTVGIRRLKVHTIVGLLPHERIHKQNIYVSIEMELDYTSCSLNNVEDLSYSVDYSSVAADIEQWIQKGQFELLESIVLLGTKRILAQYPMVQTCTMEIEKPAAIEMATGAWVRWVQHRL
jgi:FolB domain-containing protein